MRADELRIRRLAAGDLPALATFACSDGESWEDEVEAEIRGPLSRRYLANPPYFDGRMLLGFDPANQLVVVGAHHVEPLLAPDIGYTEVIAVALQARGTLVELPADDPVSLGHFMLLTIFRQMRRLGRHPRTFARVDRRNLRSLALLDRVGLTEERADTYSDLLVQRWGTLP